MKNHSVGNFCKRFATFIFLTISLVFSTPAFSQSACDALHEASITAHKQYLTASILFDSLWPSYVTAKFAAWVYADAAWKACKE